MRTEYGNRHRQKRKEKTYIHGREFKSSHLDCVSISTPLPDPFKLSSDVFVERFSFAKLLGAQRERTSRNGRLVDLT